MAFQLDLPGVDDASLVCELMVSGLSVEQAAAMKAAIANHRKLHKLVTAWKAETEKLIETEHPRDA